MMLRYTRILLVIGSFIFLLACAEKERKVVVNKPDRLLTQEQLIEVMVDFRIAEASIRHIAGKGENTKKITPYYYKPMLQKHNITIEEYGANLEYYSHDPDKMDQIYAEVVNRLSELQTEVRSR